MRTIYASITNERELLAHLPNLLSNEDEARMLLQELQENNWEDLDEFKEDAIRYDSTEEAFSEQYPGSVDEFKAEKNEDYQCLFSDYTDFYCDWLVENCSFVAYVNKHNLIIVP
jgi:hypothetical protein